MNEIGTQMRPLGKQGKKLQIKRKRGGGRNPTVDGCAEAEEKRY
jgi:hypothetical protein